VIVRFVDIGGIVTGHHCLHFLVITLGPIYITYKNIKISHLVCVKGRDIPKVHNPH